MSLSPVAQAILTALVDGAFLKSHRYLDGTKVFQLHRLDGSTADVPREVVDALLEHGYVTSNQKFPAATYMPTAEGHAAIDRAEPDSAP